MNGRSRPTQVSDVRRVQKFLERADVALDSPLLNLWALEGDGGKTFTVIFPAEPGVPFRIEHPTVSAEVADSTIVRLRPFIMRGDDIYVPKVVTSARRMVGDHAQARELLDQIESHFLELIDTEGHFRTSYMFTGAGPRDGQVHMLPDNELATHYVYGRLLHSDEWRLEELEKHGWQEEAFQSMLYQVHELMRLCYWFRQRLTMFIDVGLLPASVAPRR